MVALDKELNNKGAHGERSSVNQDKIQKMRESLGEEERGRLRGRSSGRKHRGESRSRSKSPNDNSRGDSAKKRRTRKKRDAKQRGAFEIEEEESSHMTLRSGKIDEAVAPPKVALI